MYIIILSTSEPYEYDEDTPLAVFDSDTEAIDYLERFLGEKFPNLDTRKEWNGDLCRYYFPTGSDKSFIEIYEIDHNHIGNISENILKYSYRDD